MHRCNIHYFVTFSQGKAPYDDKTDDEARQQILGGMKPLKPSGCSDEL